MFIQTETRPNPATLKFLPGRTVLASGTLDMRDRTEAAKSPLADKLFDVSGVGGVFFGSDFITVTKTDGEWPQLKPGIPRRDYGALHVRRAGRGGERAKMRRRTSFR